MLSGTMDKKKFIEEAKIMLKLNHPNVVRCFQVGTRMHEGKQQVCIITELMKTSLDTYLKRKYSFIHFSQFEIHIFIIKDSEIITYFL